MIDPLSNEVCCEEMGMYCLVNDMVVHANEAVHGWLW